MENFEKYWGIGIIAAGLITTIIAAILQATDDNDPTTPLPKWQKVLQIIGLFVGRVFSAKEMVDPNTGKAAWKVPVLQSAKPKALRKTK